MSEFVALLKLFFLIKIKFFCSREESEKLNVMKSLEGMSSPESRMNLQLMAAARYFHACAVDSVRENFTEKHFVLSFFLRTCDF